ncbi:MAG TPA: DUF2927 domain-containing protein [Symbiobacteriaceae bacterium]|nr:DUF2927 domain-containing protein [Symbiobacteriaceae bacterium]
MTSRVRSMDVPSDDEYEDAAAPKQDLSYLNEVALSGFEFGTAPSVVYKWTHDVEISVEGTPSESDLKALRTVVSDLNELVAPIKVSLVKDDGDITVYYGDDSEFPRRLSGYTPGNRGYFEVSYGATHAILGADILISTQVETAARAHLVREELTQSFGFFQDSWTDKESIFYQGWTLTQDYADRDREIIKMLYDSRIRPGMSRSKVASILGE